MIFRSKWPDWGYRFDEEARVEFSHISVLLDETIDGLSVRPEGTYVDGTLGGGGHSEKVLTMLNDQGRLIGIDQDTEAINAASERLKRFKNVTFVHNNYCNFKQELTRLGIEKVDGIMLDLGVSSYQLDNPQRGFSYKTDSPLDMRMDTSNEMTAADIVNSYSIDELTRIIRDYGEDPFARNIAKHIVAAREGGPIRTTGELVEIIRAAIPMKVQKNMGHPAKQTFQAIRIELNHELDVLSQTLDDMIESLNTGGRICVITFHSLEDRIVKNIFRKNENPCTCPKNFPVCVCGKKPKGFAVNKKPILPTQQEAEQNPRSKSAKLRVFEKI